MVSVGDKDGSFEGDVDGLDDDGLTVTLIGLLVGCAVGIATQFTSMSVNAI